MALKRTLLALLLCPLLVVAAPTFVACEGDSLTEGSKASGPSFYYPAQMEVGGVTVDNLGLGGDQVQNNTTATDTTSALTTDGSANQVAVLWMGINDCFNNRTTVQLSSDIDSWISAVRTAHPACKIVGCTMTPASSVTGPKDTVRLEVNDHILTVADFDTVVDLAADPRLDDYTDLVYYDIDQVHMNDTGYGVVADLVQVAVLGVFPDNIYVRDGASGSADGSDWTNAYDDLPANLQRGFTYYVADGNYADYDADDVVSDELRITILKATTSDHGTGTGWATAYGDGTANFVRLEVDSSWWTIDGNDSDGHGITVDDPADVTTPTVSIGANTADDVANVILRSLDIDGNGNVTGGRRCLKFNGATDILVEHCALHDCENDAVVVSGGTRITLSNLHIHTRTTSDESVHADAFEVQSSDDCVLKNSRIDWDGQQLFFGGTTSGDTWKVFGNRFYGGATSGKAIHLHGSAADIDLTVYHNTFYDLLTTFSGWVVSTTGDVRNNIFYNEGSKTWGSATHDFNYFETGDTQSEVNEQLGGDPFVDAAGDDFTLAVATLSGDSLAVEFLTDPLGMLRGSDGITDRGAYEFLTVNFRNNNRIGKILLTQ